LSRSKIVAMSLNCHLFVARMVFTRGKSKSALST
jgi:hypothetical protein